MGWGEKNIEERGTCKGLLYFSAVRFELLTFLTANHEDFLIFFHKISAKAEPISAGVSATAMFASLRASFFAAAVPFPPEIIAPACPILRPGGAVAPRNESGYGFITIFFGPGCRFFLCCTSNFTDHNN